MDNSEYSDDWIDRYLRNELSADKEAEFETMMLGSPELQRRLETAMAVQQALLWDDELGESGQAEPLQDLDARNNWQPFALAASLVLAVFSTTMYWKISIEAAAFQSEIAALNQPRTGVVMVPVDIMRSAGSQTPDVIIRKPEGNALLALDIELSHATQAANLARLSFRDPQGVELISWESGNIENSRVIAVFNAKQLPNGRVWLEMTDVQGKVIDRRLLEFR